MVYSVLSTLSCILVLIGMTLLIVDGYWYLRFRSAIKELTRYSDGFAIQICLICGGHLHLAEEPHTWLAIPQLRRSVKCDSCLSSLDEVKPARWRWRADQNANAEMAWLYNNEIVTDGELRQITEGKHTARAQAKIAEREEQRRKAARIAALDAISKGQLDILSTLEDRLIEPPAGVTMKCGLSAQASFALQKNETVLLVARPVTFGELRTQNNRPYIKPVERTGEFVITNQRYGYVGPVKSVQQKASAINWIEAKGNTLIVSRANRKTPEYFIGFDAALAEAVLKGVRRQ